MRRVIWAETALNDIDRNLSFISAESKSAAILVAERIDETVRMLAKRPIGRPGRMEGLYEKSVSKTSFIIAYKLSETDITIRRIIHSAQNWTSDDWP